MGNLCVAGLGRILKFLSAPAELGLYHGAGWAPSFIHQRERLVGLRKEGDTPGAQRAEVFRYNRKFSGRFLLLQRNLRPNPLAPLQVDEEIGNSFIVPRGKWDGMCLCNAATRHGRPRGLCNTVLYQGIFSGLKLLGSACLKLVQKLSLSIAAWELLQCDGKVTGRS